MSIEQRRSLLIAKSKKEEFSFNARKSDLICRLFSNLEISNNLPERIQLAITREKNLVVDDRVVEDEVGLNLYKFAWDGVLPAYINSEEFAEKARNTWEKTGENGQKQFKRGMMLAGDEDTLHFLDTASEEDLFKFWLEVDFIYEEKMTACNSLFRMANRKMSSKEYLDWAERFGIKINEPI